MDGTDLGILWDSGDGRCLMMFGDSYGTRNPAGGGGGGDWRCNTLAVTTDHDLSDGLHLDRFVVDTPGHAKQLIPRNIAPVDAEVTVIPTGACSVGSRQYCAFMSVHDWGAAGTWHTSFAGLAYSDDHGENWTPGPIWWNTPDWMQPFQMCTLVHEDGYVYLFGSRNGRRGPMYLARVPDDKVLDLSQHEQWHGDTVGWTKDPDTAEPIVRDEVSESSVQFHAPSGYWVMTYLQDDRNPQLLVMRTSKSLTGPWSEPTVLLSGSDYPGLYGGFLHPWTMNSNALGIVVSHWNEYNTSLFLVHLK